MAAAPDSAKAVPMSELVKLGMADITTRGQEYSPPPGNRGLNSKMVAGSWKTTITHLDASKPMIVAIRDTAGESALAARALFVQMMSAKGLKPGEAISVQDDKGKPTKAKPPPPPPPPEEDDDDDEDHTGLI